MNGNKRYTICVDFDGVLHSYVSPWVAADWIPDPPVEGAIDWLKEIAAKFEIVVHTTRAATADGRFAVMSYLARHGFDGKVEVTDKKVPALVYIDDRAYRFDGDNFPSATAIHRLRPWNK